MIGSVEAHTEVNHHPLFAFLDKFEKFDKTLQTRIREKAAEKNVDIERAYYLLMADDAESDSDEIETTYIRDKAKYPHSSGPFSSK